MAQQNKITASFSSGRGNTLDILLPDEEIKGTGPRFVDVSFAQRVAESLNTIFKNKFKITYDVFCIEELVIPEPVNLKPIFELSNPFTYENRYINDFFTSADIYLSLNEDFDWGQDEVTKGFYEFHTEKNTYRTRILNVNNKKVLDSNGGFIYNRYTIFLYDQYAKSGIGLIQGQKRKPYFKDQGGDSKWTLGGVYIHELMYHNYPDDFGKGDKSPNYLREYFLLPKNTGTYSKDHPRGNKQRDTTVWKAVRNRNLKTIWKK